MKYFSITLLLSLFFITNLSAQWSPVGAGIHGQPGTSYYLRVSSLCVYKGNLYTGGYFDSAGGIVASDIAMWNGSTWTGVDSGAKQFPYFPSIVNAMIVDTVANNLYVGGQWDTIGNVPQTFDVASWNGAHWARLQNGLGGYASELGIHAVTMYNDSLYAGGGILITGINKDSIHNIGCWNMSSWGDVNKGVSGGIIYAQCVYKGNLYAAGSFQSAAGKPAYSIAMWNGINWSALSQQLNRSTYVYALAIYNGNLIAAGQFDTAGGVPVGGIAAWNGTAWTPLGKGINTATSTIQALAVSNGKLIVGGTFDTIGGIIARNIAVYDGTNWSPLGKGVDSTVNALAEYNGVLYAGGLFDSADGKPAKCIAQWLGPLGISELSDESVNVKVYPNPSNGIFQLGINNYELGPDGYRDKNTVEVYNMLGEKVYSMNNEQWSVHSSSLSTVNSQLSIDLSGQPAGIYFYRIVDKNGAPVASGKLLKE